MAWRRRPPRKESRLRENSSSHTVKPVASGEGPRVGPRSRSPPDTPPLGPRSAPLGTDPPAAPARAHTPPARQAQPGQAAAAALGTARHDPASEAPGEPRLGCEGARAAASDRGAPGCILRGPTQPPPPPWTCSVLIILPSTPGPTFSRPTRGHEASGIQGSGRGGASRLPALSAPLGKTWSDPIVKSCAPKRREWCGVGGLRASPGAEALAF